MKKPENMTDEELAELERKIEADRLAVEEVRKSRHEASVKALKDEIEAIAIQKFGDDWQKRTGLKIVAWTGDEPPLRKGKGKGTRTDPVKYRHPDGTEYRFGGLQPSFKKALEDAGVPVMVDNPKKPGKTMVSAEAWAWLEKNYKAKDEGNVRVTNKTVEKKPKKVDAHANA